MVPLKAVTYNVLQLAVQQNPERILDGWSRSVSLVSRASLGVVAEASVIVVNALEVAALLFILGMLCRLSLCRTKACLEKWVRHPSYLSCASVVQHSPQHVCAR